MVISMEIFVAISMEIYRIILTVVLLKFPLL